jgi:hypothetical protein
MEPDWTRDAEGRSNSSPEFLRVVDEVTRLIRDGAGRSLDPQWARSTAGLIVAQLAHAQHYGPTEKLEATMREMRKAIRPGGSAQDAVDTIRHLLASVGF